MAAPTERGLQMFSLMAERSTTAILELDALDLLASPPAESATGRVRKATVSDLGHDDPCPLRSTSRFSTPTTTSTRPRTRSPAVCRRQHKDLFRYVEVKGRKKLVVRNVLTEFIPNPTFEVIAKPGSHMAFYAGENPEGKSLRELTGDPMRCIPAFREPQARLELLDEQGVHACVMFPTLASLVEERLRDDPALTQIAIHAFNEWLYEDWTYDYEGRIFTTPIVSPCILEEGIAELELVLERGAKAILVRPAPVANLRGPRSPFLAEFDPFWARVQEAGVPVMLHASDSGYQDYLNTWEGTSGEYVAFRPKTFAYVADGGRTIQDALASAICHGMLDRFPEVRLVSVENGGSWVGVLAKHLEVAWKKMPKEFPTHPLEVLAPQRLDQPVLGGVARRPDRADGRRPRLLRLRLPPPGGARRPALVRRAARRATSRPTSSGSCRATCSSSSVSSGRRWPRARRAEWPTPRVAPVGPSDEEGADWHRRVVGRSLQSAQRRSIDKGAHLIRAAAKVLERNGGASLTVQEVADEAGQSLRTLYQYFESKDDLLLAVHEEAMRTYARLIRAAIAGVDAPLERLAAGAHRLGPAARAARQGRARPGALPAAAAARPGGARPPGPVPAAGHRPLPGAGGGRPSRGPPRRPGSASTAGCTC